MTRGGRGLERAFPDLIPLERADILEDLKSLIDVHRITDFSLSDRVQPTIELRRTTEDELILSFQQGVAALAANFSFIQLFNSTTQFNLRPIAVHLENDVGSAVNLFFDTVAIGVAIVAQVTDRRRAALVFAATNVGRYSTNQAVAVPGNLFAGVQPGAARGLDVSQRLLDAIVLPPASGINFAGGGVNQAVNVSVTYKVQQINPTRPAGV